MPALAHLASVALMAMARVAGNRMGNRNLVPARRRPRGIVLPSAWIQCPKNKREFEAMKRLSIICLLLVMCFTGSLIAQTGAPAAPQTPPPAPTFARAVDTEIGIIERELVGAAEAMPEDKYDFAPASLNIKNSDFKGVRSFADQVKHVADANYLFWSPISSEKRVDTKAIEALKTKAEIVQALKDSYAYGHRAVQSLTPENVLGQVPSPFGRGQTTRFFCATFSVAHGFDHYGQLVEYLRMNGIIPPASRQQ